VARYALKRLLLLVPTLLLVDIVVQRLVDAFMCFPLTLGLVIAVRDSRVIRGAVLSVKADLYVEAARSARGTGR
jgi:ABC-type dipeptide/oligopeptide/nickel transport system permease subunit